MTSETPTPQSLHDAFVACVNRGDIASLAQLLAPDVIMIDRAGNRLVGPVAVVERMARLLSLSPTLRSTIRACMRVQDVAIVVSEWEVRGTTSEGAEFRDGGTSYDTYLRCDDGAWRIAIDSPWHALPAADEPAP